MDSKKKAIANYLEGHQGAHIRDIAGAMRDNKEMCWNTAYKTIQRMAEEGSVTIIEQRKATTYNGGVIAPGKPRTKPVKTVWLTLRDDGATSDPEAVQIRNGPKDKKTSGRVSNAPSYYVTQPGDVFGYLTVIERAGVENGAQYMLCQCACGQLRFVQEGHLRRGTTRSCGCRLGRSKDDIEEIKTGNEGPEEEHPQEDQEGEEQRRSCPRVLPLL